MLWAVFTIIAAAAQTARNAMQRQLTPILGTVGATHVRFLFGFPFALLSLAAVMLVSHAGLPHPPLEYWGWVSVGFLVQIAATALMLAAMNDRSFVVTIAYTKTEPVQVAIFGFLLLGDKVTPLLALAIVIATAGVVVMSLKPGVAQSGGWRPTLLGLVSGGAFGLSAIGYRGAILSLHLDNFVLAATFTLAVGLVAQSILLSVYLALRDPAVLKAIFKDWRQALFAGFMGALASQFWYLGFAITTAAAVRTLALVEVLFAQGISKFIFKQPTNSRELIGIAMIVTGVLLLIWAH
ncbi:MAG: EamA family transporter [Rhodopseudomonas sp.]|nr:EamA family transporter [Rhodopseudomonas sp.]